MFSTVFNLVLQALAPIAHLVASGTFLGIGFWIARLITGKLDELRVLMDKKFMASLGVANA